MRDPDRTRSGGPSPGSAAVDRAVRSTSPICWRTKDSAAWAGAVRGLRPRSCTGPSSSRGTSSAGRGVQGGDGQRGAEPRPGLPVRQQHGGGGEPVTAGVRALPHLARPFGRCLQGHGPATDGAAHVASGVGAHQQGRLGGGNERRQRRANGVEVTVREGVEGQPEQVGRLGDVAGEQLGAPGEARRHEHPARRPVVRVGVQAGPADQQQAAAGRLAGRARGPRRARRRGATGSWRRGPRARSAPPPPRTAPRRRCRTR